MALQATMLMVGIIAASVFALRRRVLSPWTRVGVVLTACAVPLWTLNGLRPLEFNTLLTTAMTYVFAIHLVSIVAMPGFPTMSARAYFGGLVWYAFPLVERSPAQRKEGLLRAFVQSVGCALLKLLCGLYLREFLLVLLADGAQITMVKNSSALTTLGAALYFCLILCSTWTNDVMQAIVPLITAGRYSVLSFDDWCLTSTSIGEFWGRRYNRIVSTLLRERVYEPLQALAGWSKEAASLASFAASALFHAHLSHTTFRAASAQTAAMFLLQGMGILTERRLGIRRRGAVVGWAWTASFIAATGPLFFGLFVRAGAPFLAGMPPFTLFDAARPWILKNVPLPPLPIAARVTGQAD